MKRTKFVVICLMILSLIVSVIGMFILPETIPTHIGPTGAPDQFGSKYFIFMFPGISIVLGIIMLLVSNSNRFTENYQKYLLKTAVIIELLFTLVLLVFVVVGISYNDGSISVDLSKIMLIIVGALLILMGNFTPKIEKNRTLGFKTKWALYNEVTWQKSQRFMGFMCVVSGVILILSGILFEGIVNMIIFATVLVLMMISSTIASYLYYKKEVEKE